MSTPSSAVPQPVRVATEWAWRGLVLAAAVAAILYALSAVSEVVIPVIVATLLAALLQPVHNRLRRVMKPGPAAGITVLGTILAIAGLLTLVVTQVANGFVDIARSVATGFDQIRDWLRTTFNITDSQFTEYADQLRNTITSNEGLRSSLTHSLGTATHAVAGLFIALFALFFFLYEGHRIWAWVVRLFPRAAREKVNSSGLVAWGQLSSFTRATVVVAFVDAVGITIGAVILRVPFAPAIGVLVFLGAFVPIVGALLSGTVAVLLALVEHGPVTALLMLGVVLLVQQLESHILQPFLLGRAVAVHPLAVILAIGAGVVLAGIIGALVAVPLVAVLNAVVKHLASPPEEGAGALDSDDQPAPA